MTLATRLDGLSVGHSYDTLNRLSVTKADGSSIHWTYDDAYRLLSETRRDSSNAVIWDAAYIHNMSVFSSERKNACPDAMGKALYGDVLSNDERSQMLVVSAARFRGLT